MSLWVAAAVLAGLFQSLRTAMQQKLRHRLTVNGAGMVRHLFGFPFVVAATLLYLALSDQSLPSPTFEFFVYGAGTAVCQIFGTLALIHSFTDRGYLVGTAFSKTEAVQAAVAAAILFDERLSMLTWAGILVGVLGVLVIAIHGRKLTMGELFSSMRQPAAAYGLAAAGLLAATGLIGQEATKLVPTGDTISAALVTVSFVMLLQCLLQGLWMAKYDRAGLRAICSAWRHSTQVGLVSALGSIAWFAAIALAPVALVRIVGQSEVVFTMWFARFYLKERPRIDEIVGLFLVAGGVVLALLGSWWD